MPDFSYKATEPGGGMSSGVISATTRADAYRILRSKGLQPVSVGEDATALPQKGKTPDIGLTRLSSAQLLYFTEELVRLIPDARSYVLPDGGHFFPNVHDAEFRRVMTTFLLES